MLTVKDALQGSTTKQKSFYDLNIGEAFKWATPRDSGPVWCMKVSLVLKDSSTKEYNWVPLEGKYAGTVYRASTEYGSVSSFVTQ